MNRLTRRRNEARGLVPDTSFSYNGITYFPQTSMSLPGFTYISLLL